MASAGIFIATLFALCAVGFFLRAVLQRVHVPPAVSLMALGVCAGPSVLDLLPEPWLDLRPVLSSAAFVVLLLRAGFAIPLAGLRAVVMPAIVFGTIPVAAELLALTGLSKAFLFGNWETALLCGFLIAAVSPAVILPTMLNQKDLHRGAARLVPDRIMGQTVVNAFVAQTGILILVDAIAPPAGARDPLLVLFQLPLALLGGIIVGVAAGLALRIDPLLGAPADSPPPRSRVCAASVLALLGALAVYFGCRKLTLENVFAVLAVGVMLRRRFDWCEPALRAELRRVWMVAEIVLFANLGTQIDLGKLTDPSFVTLLLVLIAGALGLRIVVAHLLARTTGLTHSERNYTTIGHIPKATIQAVFGAYPLTVFMERVPDDTILIDNGKTLLMMSVLAIIATAPLGAVLLDRLGERWLRHTDQDQA